MTLSSAIMTGEKLMRLGLAPLTAVNTLAHLAGLHVRPVALPCLFTLIFHHHCLGCGMTRAFDFLYTGHFRQALVSLREELLSLPEEERQAALHTVRDRG